MRYRKKQLEIEAVKLEKEDVLLHRCFNECTNWLVENLNSILPVVGDNGKIKSVIIITIEGPINLSIGNYLIKGIKNELYPCRADIFEATYEKIGW